MTCEALGLMLSTEIYRHIYTYICTYIHIEYIWMYVCKYVCMYVYILAGHYFKYEWLKCFEKSLPILGLRILK